MDPVSIKSCNDNTELILSVKSSNSHKTRFIAEIRGAQFNGAIEASTYFSGPPSLLFKEIAEKWDGWDGEIVWGAIDGELYFSANTNSLGSIILKVKMVYLSGDFELLATVALGIIERSRFMRATAQITYRSHLPAWLASAFSFLILSIQSFLCAKKPVLYSPKKSRTRVYPAQTRTRMKRLQKGVQGHGVGRQL